MNYGHHPQIITWWDVLIVIRVFFIPSRGPNVQYCKRLSENSGINSHWWSMLTFFYTAPGLSMTQQNIRVSSKMCGRWIIWEQQSTRFSHFLPSSLLYDAYLNPTLVNVCKSTVSIIKMLWKEAHTTVWLYATEREERPEIVVDYPFICWKQKDTLQDQTCQFCQ